MVDLTTTYLGLQLPSPVIVASCGLTNNINDLIEHEKNGAGAVILKSLFEEEIIVELDRRFSKMHSENYVYPETIDFFGASNVEETLTTYLELIYKAKRSLDIPVIASINSLTSHNWPTFTKYIQEAGADAIELNIFFLPSDVSVKGSNYENSLLEICASVKKETFIPVSIKISHYFSGLANLMVETSNIGISGITLFNRFFSPDIDLDTLEIIPSDLYSNANDYFQTLRWIAIMFGKANCDLSASTGIHDGKTAAKMILAGASSVQVASALYRRGLPYLGQINNELETWMESKGIQTIEQFKGSLSYANVQNPAGLLRTQFMRHFAGK